MKLHGNSESRQNRVKAREIARMVEYVKAKTREARKARSKNVEEPAEKNSSRGPTDPAHGSPQQGPRCTTIKALSYLCSINEEVADGSCAATQHGKSFAWSMRRAAALLVPS